MNFKKLILGLFLALIIGIIFLITKADKWAEHKLRTAIEEIEYLEFDSLDIQIIDNRFTLIGLEFNKPGITIKAEKLEIKSFRIYEYLLSGILAIDSVVMDKAKFKLSEQSIRGSNNHENINSGRIPEFNIMNLEISNSNVEIKAGLKDSVYAKARFDILINSIDHNSLINPAAVYENFTFASIDSVYVKTPNQLYILEVEKINYDKKYNILKLDLLKIWSLYDKYELGNHLGYESDWIKIEVDSILTNLYSLTKLIQNKQVHRIDIYNPNIEVFRDKRLPFPENNKPPILIEILSDNELSFGIDSLIFSGGNIIYQEYVKKEAGPGVISFNDLYATISDLYSYNLKKDESPRLRGQCKVMNAGQAYIDVQFPGSNSKKALFKGKMNKMDMTEFNNILEYVAFIRIKSGQIEEVDFEFSYDSKRSDGEMKFVYDDLKIEFIEGENDRKGNIFKKLESFIANTFVVHENNKLDHSFRVGKIEFERDSKRSMFNYWWKSIHSGLLSSTGVKPIEKKIDAN